MGKTLVFICIFVVLMLLVKSQLSRRNYIFLIPFSYVLSIYLWIVFIKSDYIGYSIPSLVPI